MTNKIRQKALDWFVMISTSLALGALTYHALLEATNG